MGPHGSAQRSFPKRRWHNAKGISDDARAVIKRHGLDTDRILKIAGCYGAKRDDDFNRAPAQDFKDALVGDNLANMAYPVPAFDAFHDRFRGALDSLDYGASDGIIDKCLRDGIVVDSDGKSIYGRWKRDAERLEGLNVALFRAAAGAAMLNRFIGSLAELDNYRRGRWRRDDDVQDRVSMTVGESNAFLARNVVAMVSYSASALAGWSQPVRYSPYPRHPGAERERFGAEKGGHFASEGEVHVHTGCPIPAREHVKIVLLPRCRLGKQDAARRYRDVGVVE